MRNLALHALHAAVVLAMAISACRPDCAVDDPASLHVDRTVELPDASLKGFDVSWYDVTSNRYFLADRSNAGVEVIDGNTLQFVQRIGGFAGDADHDRSGPNGLTVIGHELWAGDGDSSVKVVDLRSGDISTVSTGGSARADELSYDARDRVVLVVNNEEPTSDDPKSGPFATLISTDPDHHIVGRVVFHDATAGLEQSVWNPVSGFFYLAVPEVGGDKASGAVAVIDPKTSTLVKQYPVRECQPAGLALGPNQHLLLGCSGDAIDAGFQSRSIIMNSGDGSIAATIFDVGGSDEVWFSPTDQNYYLAARDNPSGPVLGVINAETDRWITNIPTAEDSKSVAVDPRHGRVYVAMTPNDLAAVNDESAGLSCKQGCVAVLSVSRECAAGSREPGGGTSP